MSKCVVCDTPGATIIVGTEEFCVRCHKTYTPDPTAPAPDRLALKPPKIVRMIVWDPIIWIPYPEEIKRAEKFAHGRGTSKIPVFAAVERNGQIRRQVIADVSARTLKAAIREMVDKRSCIMTDDFTSYRGIGTEFYGGHETVCHSTGEYSRGNVNTNTAESSFALVKRGIMGIYHNVSKKHLHRYLWQFDFMWNNRHMNDGERTVAGIQSAEGKRLMYKEPVRTN